MKHILSLIIFLIPLTLLADDELPKLVPRPASKAYRHVQMTPYIAKPEGIKGNYIKLTVSPKALPDPLLRYRVNVFATETETGNAYPLHLAALKELNHQVDASRIQVFRSEAYRKFDPNDPDTQQARDWLLFKAFPLYSYWSNNMHTEITADEESRLYFQLRNVYPLLEKASKKTYFDWSDEYKFAGVATLLPVVQEARTITRYLTDKANWEIRNGKYDAAIRTIRVGLAYADHILESKPSGFLVGMLVGIACKGAMHNQLMILSAQPDAPNLYPALMQLTDSKKVWLNAIQSEVLHLLPKYGDDAFWDSLDNISPEQAQAVIDETLTTFLMAAPGKANEEEFIGITRTAACLATYPHAKKWHMQRGRSEQEIEALSTYQVVVPFVCEEIKRTYDLMFVEASMPMGESHPAFNFDEYVMQKGRQPVTPVDHLLSLFTPATLAARGAFYRQTQTVDLLKIVEAIRYYAAMNGGKLPATLVEITEIPVPKVCPISGKPYDYRVEGKTAIIDYEMGYGKSRMEIVVE
jgi:hypothetical protein